MVNLLSNILLLCFTGHILGDYYLQSDKMSYSKNKKLVRLIFHSLLYAIPFAVIFVIFGLTMQLGGLLLSVCAAHFFIDLIKFGFYKFGLYKICSEKYKLKDWTIYLTDQVLHIIAILAISILIGSSIPEIRFIPALTDSFRALGIDTVLVLKWFLLILCIYKPANITFIKIFANYKPGRMEHLTDGASTNSAIDKKAGAIIGFLERLLIVIFISIQQYSAIGLILTAKSIARYDNIVKNQDFAEYYLIGTLTSVLFSMVFYGIIFS